MTSIRMSFDPRRIGLDAIEQGLLGIEFDFSNRVVSFVYQAGTVIDPAAIRAYCNDLGSDGPPDQIDVYVGNELVGL